MTEYKYKNKTVKAKLVTFICPEESNTNEFQVQRVLKKEKIKIGDTGTALNFPYGRDVQVPLTQVNKTKKIIKKCGCKVLGTKKDIDMKVNVRV